MNEILKKYLSYLELSDYDLLIALFNEKAVVCSPLYGKQDASIFYRQLFSDTNESKN